MCKIVDIASYRAGPVTDRRRLGNFIFPVLIMPPTSTGWKPPGRHRQGVLTTEVVGDFIDTTTASQMALQEYDGEFSAAVRGHSRGSGESQNAAQARTIARLRLAAMNPETNQEISVEVDTTSRSLARGGRS